MGILELLAALSLAGSPVCPATTVHYEPGPVGTPWLRVGGVTANLFYYGGRTLMDANVNQSDGAAIYPDGRTLDGATKILWRVPRAAGATLTLTARRLDGDGSFTQRFPRRGRGQFPSIVNVPQPGCWRLALRTGGTRTTFVVRAVAAPLEPVCEATVVYRDVSHPRFGAVDWMPAAPRSAGIAAVRFVSTLPDVDHAVIYAGGRAPEGWSTKFLWWSPRPAGSVELVGTRVDFPGSFRESFQSATAVDDGAIVYPSIVNIPTAGCWAVRVRIGARAGVAVFQAVVSG